MKDRLTPSIRQQMVIVNEVRAVALWVVIPYIVLCIIVRNYYWQLLVAAAVPYLTMKFAKQSKQFFREDRSARSVKKISKVEAKRKELLSVKVTPSPLTVGFLHEKGIDPGTILYDEPTHWVDAFRQFFNPFRRRDPDGSSFRLFAHRMLRMLTRIVSAIWATGWMISLVILPLLQRAKLPIPVKRAWISGLGNNMLAFMTIWTLVWLIVVLWLWPRDRFVITKDDTWVIARRWPFQNEENPKVGMNEIQSVNPTVTFLGKLFGYAHFKIISWQQPEPIPMRKFVRHPRRVGVILQEYATGDKSNHERLKSGT